MNDEAVSSMNEREIEIANLFRKLNLSKPISKTLACLSSTDKITSREIEMRSQLRQPEVSIAMKYLCKKRGWVLCEDVKKNEGKGRPVKVYRLALPLREIVDTLEREIVEENEMLMENIVRLKSYS
ncbi:transcriptional regulator [Methanohalophilus sp.]|uniref:transcriptional regulator n=1 Tax=Methanohalophilus sp. TaxID=1966352 RepID=UPI002634A770|nr:transcriptional regulator [Methanohalophilus sp.]